MTQPSNTGRRTRVTRPYPSYTLEDAMGVPEAIYRVNAGLPFDRELLAGALGTTPKSSNFTMRLNASATYGLTQGGYNDADIHLTELGEAVVAPAIRDAERTRAIAAAAMNPELFGKFYELLDGKRLPEDTYVHRLLQRELGVPAGLAEECLRILRSNGAFAGIITDEDGEQTISLGSLTAQTTEPPAPPESPPRQTQSSARHTPSASKIFIGHIGDSDAAGFAASMLDGFGIPSNSTSIAEDTGLLLPAHTADTLRSSSAAILIFGRRPDAKTAVRDKMLMLLGAASVLFDNRVVIFHEAGADLDMSLDDLNHVGFEPGRLAESGLGLLMALQRVGGVTIGA